MLDKSYAKDPKPSSDFGFFFKFFFGCQPGQSRSAEAVKKNRTKNCDFFEKSVDNMGGLW